MSDSASLTDLNKLTTAVEFLCNQPIFRQTTDRLSEELAQSPESFVWSVIDLNIFEDPLPENIRSCWIFVLKENVPSGCHYHPNSVQHMVMIKGEGTSNVAGVRKRMVPFSPANHSLTDVWYVIDEGAPHEFFPEAEDMVVVSFHTCDAVELEEISCDTGDARMYEQAKG